MLPDHRAHNAFQFFALKVKSTVLDEAVKLLTSTKGVGDNSALSLLVAMPELRKISNKQAASLVGVAPFNRDSGTMRGQRTIFGSRKKSVKLSTWRTS